MKRLLAILLSLLLVIPCGLAEEDFALAGEAGVVAETAQVCDADTAIEALVHMLARHLAQQDYTLDILTSRNSAAVHVGSSDGETIFVEYDREGSEPIRLLFDGAGVTAPDGDEAYTYGEVLDQMLFDSAAENVAGQALSLIRQFDEYDLDFLKTAGNAIYGELLNAGALPLVKRMGDDTYFTISLTPDLIEAAGVRLIERLLDYEVEIDSLLMRVDPLLRKLAPEMFEEYDPQTGLRTERGALTCAALREGFESWMTEQWLRYRAEFKGIHLDLRGRFGDEGWRVDASFFMPGGDCSVWLELCGDEGGSFDGVLECCMVGYSRATERREMQAIRFNIDGMLADNGISVRVHPETPMKGFTGLRIDCAADRFSLVIDAVTDVLDFRMELARELLDLSIVMEEFLLDTHLTWFGGVPKGSMVYRVHHNGAYFKLNESE